MSNKLEAHAFLVWRFANAREWNVSYDEIADATGITRRQVDRVIQGKGWGGRIGQGRLEDQGGAVRAWQHRRGAKVDYNCLDLTQLVVPL